MNLADRYCQKCMNYEVCQATGCADRKELEELLSKTQAELRLNEDEYELLKKYHNWGYKYVARDRNKSVYVYVEKPLKDSVNWYHPSNIYTRIYGLNNKLAFIKWEDDEPMLIADIINKCRVKF